MLGTQCGEPVIGRDEEIVSRYPCQMVKRWPMRLHFLSERLPQQLLLVGQRPPGPQGPLMNCQSSQLVGSTGIYWRYSLAEKAFPCPVIGSNIPGRAVCITDKETWAQLIHKL